MGSFEERMQTFRKKREIALKMGGEKSLSYYKQNGWLNARERLDYALDKGTFLEVGIFSHSDQPAMADRSPCDGKICGFGKVDGRPVIAMACDLTVLGASSAGVNGKKVGYCKRMSCERGIPFFFMGEAGGSRMPDTMGSRGMVTQLGNDPTQYQRLREAPWVACMLGPCYGSPTWYTMMSDFRIQRKGAVLAVSSPKVTSLATGESVDPELLGGWRLHTEVTGLADAVAETMKNVSGSPASSFRFFRQTISNCHRPHRCPPVPGIKWATSSACFRKTRARFMIYEKSCG